MDANFNTLYSKTSNFLGGQNSIKSITAIQILQDQQGISNTVLGVFGVGADGVTSYVGYANMLLTADPVLALTDPVVIQPAHVSIRYPKIEDPRLVTFHKQLPGRNRI